MEYSLKKLSKTFDQKLTKSIQKPIRIGFLSLSSMLAGSIIRSVKKRKEYSKCLFIGNHHNLVF